MKQLRDVPRTAVRTGFQVARWPLQAVESVWRDSEQKDAAWAPTLLFDRVEAGVKRTIGSLLGDDELVREGRLAEARVEELRRAQGLEDLADRERAEADAELERRRQADDAARRRVAQEAVAQERQLERARAERARAVDAEAARKAQAARKVEAASDKVVSRQEREARKVRLASEQEAIAKEKQAVQAKADVIDLDRKLERAKAARKSASR